MLVLSRQRSEVIRIGHDITIMVVDIRGDKVKLGIVADGLAIHREEIYRAIEREVEKRKRQAGGEAAE